MKKILGLCASVLMVAVSNNSAAEDQKVFGELNGQVIATGHRRIVKFDQTGKELWSFQGDNVHDVWQLPNGNVLFADNNAKEVDPKTNKIVWSYNPKEQHGGGTFAVQRLDNGLTMVVENSTGRVVEVDKEGKVVFELQLPLVKKGNHNNFRHCRKLENGNYLITHKGRKIVREYTPKGEIVQEIKASNQAFSAVRLPNGNTVIGHIDGVTEFDNESKPVWTFSVEELPDGVKTGMICGIQCLPNGNVICGIYSVPLKHEKGAGLFEITRDKKIVWRYFYPKGDRVMMGVQKLSADGKPFPGGALR